MISLSIGSMPPVSSLPRFRFECVGVVAGELAVEKVYPDDNLAYIFDLDLADLIGDVEGEFGIAFEYGGDALPERDFSETSSRK